MVYKRRAHTWLLDSLWIDHHWLPCRPLGRGCRATETRLLSVRRSKSFASDAHPSPEAANTAVLEERCQVAPLVVCAATTTGERKKAWRVRRHGKSAPAAYSCGDESGSCSCRPSIPPTPPISSAVPSVRPPISHHPTVRRSHPRTSICSGREPDTGFKFCFSLRDTQSHCDRNRQTEG